MFKKKKTYVIILVIVLIIGGVFYSRSKKPKAEYTTAEAQKGTLAQTVSVTGKTFSPTQVDLSFKYSGRISELNVNVGDHVTKGERIAVIDKGTLMNQLRQAQAQVAQQKQTLAAMKRGAYKIEQENAQKAVVQSAEAAVAQIYDQLKETVIYSPMDGIVIRKNVDVGETTVANAVTENTSVVTIASEGNLEIEANVPESDISKVVLGQKSSVTLDALGPEETFDAHVSNIEPASTIIQDVVYYKVKFQFEKQDSRIRNGMSADVDIHTAEKNNVVFVPLRAIKTENGSKYVEVLTDEKNSITKKENVTTGMEGDDGMTEIKSGLSGGEKVVTLTKTQ